MTYRDVQLRYAALWTALGFISIAAGLVLPLLRVLDEDRGPGLMIAGAAWWIAAGIRLGRAWGYEDGRADEEDPGWPRSW